jgi:hypothetical protein
MMMRGGGGGGIVRNYVIEPLKNLTLFTGAVYLIGGTSAAVAFVWFVFHVVGLSAGYVTTGFPVGVDSFHQGSGQMTKYMDKHPVPGAKKNAAGSWAVRP